MNKTEAQIVSYGILYLNSQFENFKSSSPRQIRDAELNCPCGSFARGV